jgi:hypothetical protein
VFLKRLLKGDDGAAPTSCDCLLCRSKSYPGAEPSPQKEQKVAMKKALSPLGIEIGYNVLG